MNGKTATLLIRYASHLNLPDKKALRKLKKQWLISNITAKTNERKLIKATLNHKIFINNN
jgi:hypothetical protein